MAMIATVSTDAIRMPERVRAGKFVINGVPLAPIEKTIENGKKMIAFRTEATGELPQADDVQANGVGHGCHVPVTPAINAQNGL